MVRILLRVWQKFPIWVHLLASRLVRPRFRVAVAALIFDEQGRVLLFKHTYRKFEWGLPAGSLEHREQPERAVLREFLEETGMQIEVQRLLLAESSKDDHHVSLIYLCRLVSGEFRESNEISEIRYFALNDLPQRMLSAEKDLIRRVAGML
ncbi:MAG: NUDIX domain-containing protein [Chloroflexi bacterium]|nr:NUDIX domain-containing protein [Chloroflexota bacterium]